MRKLLPPLLFLLASCSSSLNPQYKKPKESGQLPTKGITYIGIAFFAGFAIVAYYKF